MTEIRKALGPGLGPGAWVAAAVAPVLVAVVGSLVQPEVVYDGFVWKYFVGPIDAETQRTPSIVRDGVTSATAYTAFSVPVYGYYLLLGVVGSVRVLERLDIGDTVGFFYALVPFGLLGGATRVLDDIGAIPESFILLFISPVIYLTMFAFTVAVFAAAVLSERRGLVDDYYKAVAGAGAVSTAGVVAYLAYLGFTDGNPGVVWAPPVVVGAATVVSAAVWFALKRFAPWMNEGTGRAGLVLLWGHLLDAFSTVVGVEYLGYGEKQPLVDTIIDVSGTTYAFVVVKAAIVLLIIYAFDERFFEEFDRLPYILLVAVLAVGLGPGTRNTVRMGLGI